MLQVLNIYHYRWSLFSRVLILQNHVPSFFSTSEGKTKRGRASGRTTQTQKNKKSSSVPLENADEQSAVKEADPHVLTASLLTVHL